MTYAKALFSQPSPDVFTTAPPHCQPPNYVYDVCVDILFYLVVLLSLVLAEGCRHFAEFAMLILFLFSLVLAEGRRSSQLIFGFWQ